MSGETEQNVSGWTVDTLHELMLSKFLAAEVATSAALAAAEKAVNAALIAADKATSKAEMAADKRFESVNEFRQALTDQNGTFMPRAEAEARIGSNQKDISTLTGRLGEFLTREEFSPQHKSLADKTESSVGAVAKQVTDGFAEHRRADDGQFTTITDRINALTLSDNALKIAAASAAASTVDRRGVAQWNVTASISAAGLFVSTIVAIILIVRH